MEALLLATTGRYEEALAGAGAGAAIALAEQLGRGTRVLLNYSNTPPLPTASSSTLARPGAAARSPGTREGSRPRSTCRG